MQEPVSLQMPVTVLIAAKIDIFCTTFGPIRISLRASGIAVVLLFAADSASAHPHSVDPMDWLIQHICPDSAGRPIAVTHTTAVGPVRSSAGFNQMIQCLICVTT